MSRLQERYVSEVTPALRKEFGYRNVMAVPKLKKIVVNMGFGIVEKDVQKKLIEELAGFTGQHPQLRQSRKSVSNFKLRAGMVVGARVTLRGDRMYEFMDRLVNVALPRIRDFRGLSTRGFDGRGNYTFGLKEQTIFPEIDPVGIPAEKGMDITFCTTTDDNTMARELMTLLGVPFSGTNPK